MGDDVVGVVLGAGSSTRLGQPKQLLPLGDTTLLGWVIDQAERSALDRVIVVVGGGGDAVERSLRPTRATIARNDAYGTGCASSLLAGLDAAGDCRAVVLLLGDMPGVDAAVIDTVLASWTSDPTWAAVTSYRGDLGHPFVFAAEAFPTLRTLHGDKAVWKLVDGQPAERVRRLAVDRPLPLDVDTWADYDAVRAQLQIVT
ncbi:MAG: molybdenum cofactor biosynthesis protein [Acidimicrobiales bacterium]|jgi:molybdenum cofactor cytidylyltransferase|nr:molybdenum cofactor biosynthesis protein [Acidimicrobiales bacterium]